MIGIDEVGRGCWAGPLLVVAARMRQSLPNNLKDSKALTKLQRINLFEVLKSSCEYGEGWVEPIEIDALGLTEAMRLGVVRALTAITATENEKIIMDGTYNYCSLNYKNVRCEAKADELYPIVSAASIYAKVLRDNRMIYISHDHPGYGFETNVGYGTRAHLEALKKQGPTSIHRLSFKPLKSFW